MKRLLVVVLIALAVVVGAVVLRVAMPSWYVRLVPAFVARRIYPLKYSATIASAAEQNRLDPALVAAVIYEESRFRQSTTSVRGAVGLMQLLPSTAEEIARKTGGVTFVVGDLTDPVVNIRYGCNYLRYLLDQFHGSTIEAVAAYNAGVTNVQAWIRAHNGGPLRIADIPFAETRTYVVHVGRMTTIYRRAFGAALGPAPAGFAAIR